MDAPTPLCVVESMLIKRDVKLHSIYNVITLSLHMYQECPLLMEHRDHDDTFGHLLLLSVTTVLTSATILCPCSNNTAEWPYRVPSFIGNNYFCESGRQIAGNCASELGSYYPDDVLWDGQGCPASSSCCGLNSPPWFCTTLPDTTSDDLEIRLCGINIVLYEDTLLSSVDIYVK